MTVDREAAIRDRAYALWEEEGRPLNRSLDHWLRAEAEIAAADPPAGVLDDGKSVTARGNRRAQSASKLTT